MNRTIRASLLLVLLSGCQVSADSAPDSSAPPVIPAPIPTRALPPAVLPPAIVCAFPHIPDPTKTPGKLCSPSDPNFDGYRYPGHVAHCRRNLPVSEKARVAAQYGIPRSAWSQYEFDHYIPLAIGGSNDDSNIWPQRLDEARQKDVLEDEMYREIAAGKITQTQATDRIRMWRPASCD